MFAHLVLIALSLAAQIGGAGRYDASSTAGQPAATGTSPSSGSAVNAQSPPANNGGSRNSSSTTNGSGLFPPSPPPDFGTSSPAAPAQPPSSSAQPPPSFPTDQSALAQQQKSGPKPSAMMQAMLTAPSGSQLRGEMVPLVQVIVGARTRSEQTMRVEAYWDLCSSVADYYLGLREQDELRKLGSLGRPGAALQDAEKELGMRLGTSQRAARATQLRLANLMGRSSNFLPLPADMPHCGSYTTRYEQIFAGRSVPEAQELAALLPQRYSELKDAAAAVTRAEEWLDGVVSRNESPDALGNQRALELLALRRRAFVQIARDYNRRIARYSELATPGQISAERLTGMLIKRPASPTAPRSTSPLSPSGRPSGSADAGPQRTFAEDWTPVRSTASSSTAKNDGAVTPASAAQSAPRTEKSLIVPRSK